MKLFSAIYTQNAKRLTLIALAAFLTYNLALVTFVSPVFAQPATASNCVALPPDPNNPPTAAEEINQINDCAIESNVYDDKMFNFNQMSGTADSLYTLLLGYSALHPETNTVTADSGTVQMANNMIASMYARPPISGTYYVAQMIQKVNPVQPAFAQTLAGGIGYSILQPVNAIWSSFRNAAYVGFVIIFVVIGFMIMFRRKISSQAVATIQDSLPRIVIALILVTFSYAIVGLLIDAMFVILNVIAALLVDTGQITKDGTNKVFTNNIFSIVFESIGGIYKSVSGAVSEMLKNLLAKGLIGGTIGWIGGSILGIIAAIAVLMVSLRIFLMLLMSYVSLILLTIFAPFILLFEALPGNNSFNGWFKQIIANLSVFPTVAVMIMLAAILSGIGGLGATGGNAIKDESIGQFPLLSGVFEAGAIGQLIGLGLLLMTPAAAKIVKERLGVKEGALGAGAGVAMAGIAAGAAPFQKAGGSLIAPYKQAFGYERQQKAYHAMTGKQMYGSHPQSEPGNPHGGE